MIDSFEHTRLSHAERFAFTRAAKVGRTRVALHFDGNDGTHVSTWLTLSEARALADGDAITNAFYDLGGPAVLRPGAGADASLAAFELLRRGAVS